MRLQKYAVSNANSSEGSHYLGYSVQTKPQRSLLSNQY